MPTAKIYLNKHDSQGTGLVDVFAVYPHGEVMVAFDVQPSQMRSMSSLDWGTSNRTSKEVSEIYEWIGHYDLDVSPRF